MARFVASVSSFAFEVELDEFEEYIVRAITRVPLLPSLLNKCTTAVTPNSSFVNVGTFRVNTRKFASSWSPGTKMDLVE